MLIPDTPCDEETAIFHTHFASDPMAVADVTELLIDKVSQYADRAGILSDIEIVVTEVINNIVEHAYRDKRGCPIEMFARRIENGIGFLFVDRGVAMPGAEIPVPAPHDLMVAVSELPEGGFGWKLIRNLAKNLQYNRSGGENRLSFSVTIDP